MKYLNEKRGVSAFQYIYKANLLFSLLMEFRRREEETKKEYYRRIAEVKKQTWADQHHLQEDEFYKSHFVIPDEEYSHDIQKSKKIAKIEYRAEQRLRNRVAAQ